MRISSPLSRFWHRRIAVFLAIPLLLTILSGSIYSILLAVGIDAFWLIKLHTGNFGVINLQFIYSPLIGIFTLMLLLTGVSLLRLPQEKGSS